MWCHLGLTKPVELVLPVMPTFDWDVEVPSHFLDAFDGLAQTMCPLAAAAGGSPAFLKYLLDQGKSSVEWLRVRRWNQSPPRAAYPRV